MGNTAAWAVYDPSRVAILTAYHDTIINTDPYAIHILEHFADNTEEKILSDNGMLLWGNMNSNYRYASIGATTGTNSDLTWGVYTSRGWTQPNLVTYMESHDEDRQMYYSEVSGTISGTYNIKDTLTALNRMALNAAFFFLLPGPKMIWQFGERGYDYSINWPCMNSNCRLDPKPPRWDYLDQYPRKHLLFIWSELIKLRTENQVFATTNFELDLSGTFKKIRLHDTTMSVIVLGNFGVTSGVIIPKFYNNGTWYDYLTGDSLVVTNINGLINLNPGEYRIYTSKKLATPLGSSNLIPENAFISIYPNPNLGKCHIEINYPGFSHCAATIYDIRGSKVKQIYYGDFDQSLNLNWEMNTKGIYFLKVILGNQVFVKKIIIT